MIYGFPEIEGIDWEEAHHYLNTKDVLVDSLCEYVKSASKQVDDLRSFRDLVAEDPSKENFGSFRICAHAMKSILRSIGAAAFSEAYELECAGRDKDAKTIMEKTDHFAYVYMSLAERLKCITGDVDVAADYNEDIFYEKIKAIRAAMEAFDINTLQDAHYMIQDMATPPEYAEELKRLEKAVMVLESEQVIASCDALMKNLQNCQ